MENHMENHMDFLREPHSDAMYKDYFKEALELKNKLLGSADFLRDLQESIEIISGCFRQGNKILVAGNGGSAADAQHLVAEIVGRYKRERRGYPAIALTANTSILTAWSNDYDFKSVFSRQIESLGNTGDVFIGISTSGNSENIVEAVKKSKERGLKTISLLGGDGGKLRGVSDVSLIVPSFNTPRIQEIHIFLIHIICEESEKNFET